MEIATKNKRQAEQDNKHKETLSKGLCNSFATMLQRNLRVSVNILFHQKRNFMEMF